MTSENDIFANGRDEQLGKLLRDQWQPADDGSGFLEAVMARARTGARETSWDVLARWAPVGLAAAVLLALGIALSYNQMESPSGQWTTAAASDPAVQLLASPEPVTDELVTAVAVGISYPGDGR